MAKNEHKQHQADLAKSGYRLPDMAYVEPPGVGLESAEQSSGDGGTQASDLEQTSADVGYQGALKTADDVKLDADALRTVDPATGLTIPGEPEIQAEIARTGGEAALREHAEENAEENAQESANDADAGEGEPAGGQKQGGGPSENKAAKTARKATGKRPSR